MVEEEDFINKIWPQNCGDNLKVIKKTSLKKYSTYLYECEFIKYPYKILAIKAEILRKSILNPQIEQVEFIDKIWPQNCGDDLKILRKSDKKRGNYFLWECEFIKYPYKVLAAKNTIISGKILNPSIEQNEFVGKEFKQKCNDILKVLKKTNQYKNTAVYYECEFKKYPCKILAIKNHIINGYVNNPNLPYKHKDTLIQVIKEKFQNKKPTLFELSDILKINATTLGQYIIKFDLRNYISYSYSGLENKFKDFVKSFISNIKENYYIENDKKEKKEIDIYIPDFNLGIEINGNYWHSSAYKDSNFHQEKSLFSKEKGINLIHIFEYEFNDLSKRNIIKSLIKSKLGIFDKKIYARQCNIKELEYKEYADFCNENHLQGECGAKVKLGLFCQNELVQIISFGSPRFTDKYEWEIIRECSKLGYQVVGGKEKLWKYFLKKYNPNNCISYCDFSKFSGESYLRLGFKFKQLNKPGFVWWYHKMNQIFWRNPYKHKEIKEKGYLKIYDAGQLVFVWNKTK